MALFGGWGWGARAAKMAANLFCSWQNTKFTGFCANIAKLQSIASLYFVPKDIAGMCINQTWTNNLNLWGFWGPCSPWQPCQQTHTGHGDGPDPPSPIIARSRTYSNACWSWSTWQTASIVWTKTALMGMSTRPSPHQTLLSTWSWGTQMPAAGHQSRSSQVGPLISSFSS